MPSQSSVHELVMLRNISIATGRGEYIAGALAPAIPVPNQSNKFWKWDVKGEANRIEDSVRAEGTAAQVVDAEWTKDTYSTVDHSLAGKVTDEMRSNADVAISPEIDVTEVATRKLLVQQDKDLKTLIDAAMTGNTTTTIGGASPGGAKWDANGDAIKDVLEGMQKIADADQVVANVLAMSRKVFWKLKTNANIIERVKASGSNDNAARVSLRALAQVFEVEMIAVALAYENTANLAATKNMSDIWGDDVYLAHIPPRPGFKIISGAYTFVWNDSTEGNALEGHFVRTWRDAEKKSDMIAVHRNYEQKIISATSIHKFDGTLT